MSAGGAGGAVSSGQGAETCYLQLYVLLCSKEMLQGQRDMLDSCWP